MISPDDVTAIIVTRGNVSLRETAASLSIYRELVVWDNSERYFDKKTYGRWLALETIHTPVAFMVDDDVVFTAHDKLLAAYEPEQLTVNMPDPWWSRTGYDRDGCLLVGAGALVPKGLPRAALDLYLAHWPEDDLFLTYCDFVVGLLTPGSRHDFGYRILPWAEAPGRICTTDGAADRKRVVQERCYALRDEMAA